MSTKRKTIGVRAMDPQCGRSVDPEKAIRLTWEGKTYFFFAPRNAKRDLTLIRPGMPVSRTASADWSDA